MSGEQQYSSDALGYYAILEAAPDADIQIIRRNYRDKAKKWHPDHNTSPEAMEIFQKLSVAHNVLSDEDKRLTYDLACLAHGKENFPDIFSLKIYTDGAGKNTPNLRIFIQQDIRGCLIKSRFREYRIIATYKEAVQKMLKISALNWLLGWWSAKSALKTAGVLKFNYRQAVPDERENLRLLVHNALAFEQEKMYAEARSSAAQAWEFARPEEKELLNKFLDRLPKIKETPIQAWNYGYLRRIQLIVPGIAVGIVFLFMAGGLLGSFAPGIFRRGSDKINYYQEVELIGGRGIDDMVVAKILDIRDDLSSSRMLFHLKTASAKVMYGPSDNFDVLTVLKDKATVRVTGISPDKAWLRIMLDNGDEGFVHADVLAEGIGAPIPSNSKIFIPN